ncbi:cupredoxin domain-containing protein [Paenibacillus pinistramenti]|uniref:cupredoxin domain-containing protein n=1 Tax=Paenibacillus pinistramenti TaxID=1768003 RepID=UPI001109F5A0|nr:cupredoxin domain-containing protein [Paenibacillus pinistramenti]
MQKCFAFLLTGLILLSLTACARGTKDASSQNTDKPDSKAEAHLKVKAVNYQFDQQVYHLKEGVPVEITLDSAAGNHGLKIPDLDVKLDQAHPSVIITPDKPGTYEMSCSIPCGPGHKNMTAQVIVE